MRRRREILSRFLLLAVVIAAAAVAMVAWRKGLLVTPARVIFYAGLPGAAAVAALMLALLRQASHRWLGIVTGIAALCAVIAAEMVLPDLGRSDPAPAVAATPGTLPHACPHMVLDGGGGRSPINLDGREFLPLGGVAHNPLSADRQTDRHGFNNPDSVWDEPASILAIGDSFTFGAGVPIGQGFVDRLREAVGGVVNLGCGGNGPLAELASLVEYGPLLRPRTVVWGFFEGNDLTKDLPREMEVRVLTGYLAGQRQDLADHRVALDQALRQWLGDQRPASQSRAQLPGITLRAALRLDGLRTALGLHAAEFSPETLAGYHAVLQKAVETAATWGGTVTVVYLPAEQRYATLLGAMDADYYAERVIATIRATGAKVIDLRPVFNARPDPRALFDGHYTSEGYALVARVIRDGLAPE